MEDDRSPHRSTSFPGKANPHKGCRIGGPYSSCRLKPRPARWPRRGFFAPLPTDAAETVHADSVHCSVGLCDVSTGGCRQRGGGYRSLTIL